MRNQICNGAYIGIPLKYFQAVLCSAKKLLEPERECPPIPKLGDITAPDGAERQDLQSSFTQIKDASVSFPQRCFDLRGHV